MSKKLTAAEVNAREWPTGTTLKDKDGDFWFTSGVGDWICLDPDFEGAANAHEPYEIISPVQGNEPPVCNCGISQADLKNLFESSTDGEALARLKDYAGIKTPHEGEVWVIHERGENEDLVATFANGEFRHFVDGANVYFDPRDVTLIKRLWPEGK